jgi:periplasmic divalent cation tolerance protein
LESGLANPMGETVYVIQTTLTGELNEAEVGFWAQSIIDSKLAACVNVKKVQSIFRWEGNIESIAEWQIQIKTSQVSKETLISKIKEENFYENPEILCWPAESTKEYSDWVKGE